MIRAGLIVGVVAFVLSICGTLLSPLLVPCAALFTGFIAGYLAGMFDKPTTQNDSLRKSATAGAIGSGGSVLGLIAGSVANTLVVGPEGNRQLLLQLGMDPGPSDAATTAGYYVGVIGGALCFSILSIVMAGGFGALGGFAWWKVTGESASAAQQPPAQSAG